MIPVLVPSVLQVSTASHYSQRSGTAGNTFETCGTNFTKKRVRPRRASRLVLPQIAIRRDPKLFMQETPVLALRVQHEVQSCAARELKVDDTATQERLGAMHKLAASMTGPRREYDHQMQQM